MGKWPSFGFECAVLLVYGSNNPKERSSTWLVIEKVLQEPLQMFRQCRMHEQVPLFECVGFETICIRMLSGGRNLFDL